jgi:hypothetical protein
MILQTAVSDSGAFIQNAPKGMGKRGERGWLESRPSVLQIANEGIRG